MVAVMMAFTVKLMLSALAAGALPEPPDGPAALVTPEVAVQRVAACGFKNVRSRFDDLLRQDVIEVADFASATEKQLRCAAGASLSSRYSVIFPHAVQQGYAPLYWRLQGEQQRADAKAWLEKKGLLSRLPVYDPKRTDSAAFVRSLEALCGPGAAGALTPMAGMAVFKPEALSIGRMDDEALQCLSSAAAAADFPLGVIGNEARQQTQ